MTDKPAGKIDWLASYPKSGNTWMRMMLANYFSETDEPHDINKPGVTNGIASSRRRFDEFLGIGSSDLTEDEVTALQPHVYRLMAARGSERQWIKVHDAQMRLGDGRWLFPPDVSGVVIYLLRNPLDVAVSFAFHEGHGDMARAAARLCDPEGALSSAKSMQLRQFMGTWSRHVESWIDQVEIPVLAIRYEDMLIDAGRELRRVIAFARPRIAIDAARIEHAVAHARFENLQAAEDVRRFHEAPPQAERFFRKGRAGDWRDHLSPAQVMQLVGANRKMMERFGYETALEDA